MTAIEIRDDGPVRSLVLCRPDEMNTITPELRSELEAAIAVADADKAVKVILLRAEGRAFCAGFSFDFGFAAQATEGRERVWDSVRDLHMISRFANAWARLHTCTKPTIAAVQGWCVGGGTDMVLSNADRAIGTGTIAQDRHRRRRIVRPCAFNSAIDSLWPTAIPL